MRISKLFASSVLLVLATGCGGLPVAGDWESDKKLSNGEKNTLDVYDDFTADAKIYATPTSDPTTWVRFEFDVDWYTLETDGQYRFDLTCSDGPCDGDDFTMECNLIEIESDGAKLQKLDCNGESKWDHYPLQWERK